MPYGEFGEWIDPGPGGSQPEATGYYEPEAVASRKADAAAGPGMARFHIPHADRGQDNKYDYVKSLIAQGATFADGTPLKGTDKMWGKDVYIPADKLQADKIVGLVDYNPKEDKGGFLGLGAAGNALFIGLLTAGAAAAFAGAGAAGAGAGGATSTGGAAAGLGDIAAFEAASATVPAWGAAAPVAGGAAASGLSDLAAFEEAAATVPSWSATQAAAPVVELSDAFNTVPTGSAIPPGLTTEAMTGAGSAAARAGLDTASTAAKTGSALSTVADGIRTAGTLAGVVTAVNGVLGDPLNLNEGSDAADAANKAASDSSAASAEYTRQMADIAKQQWEFYKTNYQPVELDMIRQAKEAGSPEEFARARGAANADVTGSFDRARKDILRDSQSRGINPASGAGQSTEASIRLAEGATRSGALTGADNLTRNLMWSKGLDVANLGRNIPRDSSAALGNASNTANQNSRVNTLNAGAQQERSDNTIQNVGYGLNTIADTIDKYGPTVKKWFGYKKGGPVGYRDGNFVARAGMDAAAQADMIVEGRRRPRERIIEAERSDQGVTMRDERMEQQREIMSNSLPTVAHKAGGPPAPMPMGAFFKRKRYAEGGRIYGPHMRRYAMGGEVEEEGLEPRDMMTPDASQMGTMNGPGTETSDSIPAVVDGQEPAALSTNEFVMNAEVPKMTGEEILEAINQAGLAKRQGAGLEPQMQQQSFARGGRINRRCAGL